MKLDSKSTLGILLITISILTLIPFIGLTDFHTKGEPREAIVAVSMLSLIHIPSPRDRQKSRMPSSA